MLKQEEPLMADATSASLNTVAVQGEAFAERVMQAAAGALEVFSIYIGDQLRLYEALASRGRLTSRELADRTGTHERYAREWLEQQCVVGILGVENPEDRSSDRRYFLPEGHADVLVARDSLNYMAPLSQLLAGAVKPLESVIQAFRTGNGVDYSAYGRDVREGQARMNRPMFLNQLGQEWLPAIPGIRKRLLSDPPARIADFGCGGGWSSIGMAQCYPKVLVDGFDLDQPSIELARRNAEQAGVSDRVKFYCQDAASTELAGEYDLITACECVHDMSKPVAALRTMRKLGKPDAPVLIVDERVADRFDPNADGLEWLMYGASILHCLPVGMADQPSAATGTVMRRSTLEQYAYEAGFASVEVLPIDHPMFRFYLLRRQYSNEVV
jgi:2-polyprenyl-3-methyl-5-hydroxy-6-metoxy-1,4-benzoquinol methylase